MAIKALEQQPCPYWDYELETCRHANVGALATKPYGDVVSKQAVLESIEDDASNGVYSYFASYEDAQKFKETIKALPPVTPIRPKGEWEYDETIQNWRCSKCHETPKTLGYVGTKEFMTEHFKFCNHCGADM